MALDVDLHVSSVVGSAQELPPGKDTFSLLSQGRLQPPLNAPWFCTCFTAGIELRTPHSLNRSCATRGERLRCSLKAMSTLPLPWDSMPPGLCEGDGFWSILDGVQGSFKDQIHRQAVILDMGFLLDMQGQC